MPPAAWSISISSRNICSWFMPPRIRTFSTRRPPACSTRPRGSAFSAAGAEVLRPAARLYHDLADPAALPERPRSIRSPPAPVCALLARAADVPDFPALEAHVADTQREVRRCFARILGAEPAAERTSLTTGEHRFHGTRRSEAADVAADTVQ